MGNPPAVAARGRSPQRKHFKESMAAKVVLCFVLISALATLATSRSQPEKPPCTCMCTGFGCASGCDPTDNGQCFVPCDADCSDIQRTSDGSCLSHEACERAGFRCIAVHVLLGDPRCRN